MKRRICVNCEAEISDSALICTNCGLPFKSYKYANNENIAQIILKGNTYYNKEEYEKAFYCYKEACDCGDPIGYMKLGDCFRIAYHQQLLNFFSNGELIAEYGRKAFELYRFSCQKIPNWSENRNRWLYMELNMDLIPKLKAKYMSESADYFDVHQTMDTINNHLKQNLLPSNLDNMGTDPFYLAINILQDDSFNKAILSLLSDGLYTPHLNTEVDHSCYEKIFNHPRSDRYLIIDACMRGLNYLLDDSFSPPTDEKLHLAGQYLSIAKNNGAAEVSEKYHYFDYRMDTLLEELDNRESEDYEERMHELEEQFAEEDAAEIIRQWELEQDDSMPHNSDIEYYYNMYYNDDFSYDDYEEN